MLWEHERNYGLGMDALVSVCSWNTNEIMVWAWMLWSSYALGTRTRLWFGHGCSGHRMLWEHERDYGLGMDALVSVCSWNTNEIMVWAWMLWSAYALATRTRLWFGHGCPGQRMLLEHNEIMVWAWMLWSSYALGTRMRLCLAVDALVSVCSWNTNEIWLCMDALVIVCSGNTNEIMVWAWMHWSSYALGTRTRLWFGRGCSGHRMLWEHERDYGLGMDALVIVCSWNTNEIMVWAWMLWSAYALGTRTRYGLGMDALVSVCSGNTRICEMLRWLCRKAVAFLLNSLELEEKPAHSGIFCEASYSLLCCPQGQNVRFVRSHSEPCHPKHGT